MKTENNIVVIGTGAQAKYIKEIDDLNVVAVVRGDREIDEEFKKDLESVEVLENLESFKKYASENEIKAIVAVADNRQKEFIVKELEKLNIELINVIHPKAVIAKSAKIGRNVLINAGAVIQPYVSIGNGVMIHANVVIDHNSLIEDYVNLGPGAKLAGWVKVRKGVYVYTGVSVIPNIDIGAHSVVGAGSVVIKDVPANVKIAGNPAEIINGE